MSDPRTLKIVFFGDSRAAYWPPPDNVDHFSFVNRGIGNQTSEQTIERFDAHITPLHPDIIVLQVGINDLKTIPLFPERKDEIIKKCKTNIQEITRKSVNNGAIVILTTIFPTGYVPLERRLFWSSDIDRAVEEVNDFIRTMEDPNVVVLDSYFVLSKNGMIREEFSQDTLHINAAGYAALNRELTKVLTDDIKVR